MLGLIKKKQQLIKLLSCGEEKSQERGQTGSLAFIASVVLLLASYSIHGNHNYSKLQERKATPTNDELASVHTPRADGS